MTQLHKTMYDLLSYNYLEAEWDGYGAIKPKKEVISSAWKLLGVFIDNKVCAPKVMIAGSSAISFFWNDKENNDYVEIGLCIEDDDGIYDNTHLEEFYWFIDYKDKPLNLKEYDGEDDIAFNDFNKTKVFKYLIESRGELQIDNHEDYYFNLFSSKEII